MDVEKMTNDEFQNPTEIRMTNSKWAHYFGRELCSFGIRKLFRHSSFVIRPWPAVFVAGALAGCVTDNPSEGPSSSSIAYPVTRKTNVVDDYSGVKVADPYRWLEDDNSPETKAWVEGQNKVTFGYLQQIPELPDI